jgi:hypothetical protein
VFKSKIVIPQILLKHSGHSKTNLNLLLDARKIAKKIDFFCERSASVRENLHEHYLEGFRCEPSWTFMKVHEGSREQVLNEKNSIYKYYSRKPNVISGNVLWRSHVPLMLPDRSQRSPNVPNVPTIFILFLRFKKYI